MAHGRLQTLLAVGLPDDSGLSPFPIHFVSRVIFITGDTVNSKTYDFVSSTGNLTMNKTFQMAELRIHIGQLTDQNG